MQKIIGYKGTCKSCNWVFAESKTPNINNMPAMCDLCKKEMHVTPVFEEDEKGYTYEISIFRKETGVTIRESVSIGYDVMKGKPQEEIEKIVQLRLCEIMLKVISAGEGQKNDNIKKLII